MHFNNFLFNIKDNIAFLTVNRPEVRNALNSECWSELEKFIDIVNKDESIKVAIITGEGRKAFVSGADINFLRERTMVSAIEGLAQNILIKLSDCNKPIIAAINGLALGAGCELAMACDIRIASENASFGLPELGLGILPSAGGTQRLAKLVGLGRAKEIILTGRMVKATEAREIGLVSQVVSIEDLMQEAISIANIILKKAPIATRLTKKLISSSMSTDQNAGMLLEILSYGVLMASDDKKEGVEAFFEREHQSLRINKIILKNSTEDYMKKAVIVSAVRAGTGAYGGQWTPISPEKLAGIVIKEAVKRAKVDPNEIEDVLVGNLYGQHGNIARVVSLEAGLPFSCGATTVDRQCASSLQCVYEAAMNIMVGNGDVYVAAGLEHTTREPWQLEKASSAYQFFAPNFLETRLTPDEYGNTRMGITAENVAEKYNLTRSELDEFSIKSHKKAYEAIEADAFKEQIIPIELTLRKGKKIIVDGDESVRTGLTMESMGKLRPVFKKDGIVTAGNSCPRNDGAAAIVVMSEERAKSLGIEPMAMIKSFAVAGLDPDYMGLGPIYAAPKALKRAGITVNDLDWIELNEAFAAQSIPCIRELGFNEDKVNPNGGAIALGHPLGATGAILTTKALYAMKDKELTHSLITMCIGGGQGAALVLEREI